MFAMQEILSKTVDPNVPLADQEFYELRLDDLDHAGMSHFCVRQARARWDDNAGQAVWDEVKPEEFVGLQEAKDRYEKRRLALTERGFIYSDLDF